MFSGPDELQHLSSEIAVFGQNGRFQSRGVAFPDVGLSDSRFVSIFGRSKIGCDSEVRFGSKEGKSRSRRSSDGAPERDKRER